MNKKVEKFAKKVGFTDFDLMHHSGEMLEKFAELIRADERRECERLLGDKRDSLERQWQNGEIGVEYCFQWRTVDELMEAIRARVEK